ncbi:nitrogen fixation protein NifZ [Motiliproteus sp. SC1-56]|uniref:nitrogen fixation protein NifZ n=1 Tax=Motiliproteus sp. SC1-56 TaxID=2799565 RepID=UPI001A8F5DE7|nr:nitrogen fixation protein NifZ [Motiliproteus sp. SC1-56]
MFPKYEYGQALRVIRTIRDDGSYPGKQRGDLLIPRGSVGHVADVGTFLQDQIIYRVHFIEAGIQVGCRETELIPAERPWIDTRFEFRQAVVAARDLAVNGKVRVVAGETGQILKVIRDAEGAARYQVRFPGQTFEVRETALQERVLAEEVL